MDILILGGTGYLGPELVAAALANEWKVTLFNRGKTNPGKFAELEQLRGDRDPAKGEGLKAIEAAVAAGRHWDAVIDTSGYVPRTVAASAALLAPVIHQYVFISTISVYAEDAPAGADEDAALAKVDDPKTEKVTGQTYGALKALCETAARDAKPEHVTVIRPGLIVGPGDPTDRFTYWPARIARGGRVLVPAPAKPREAFVSFIDVRDLAEWTIRMVEDGHTGTFNATGPAGRLTFGEMVDGCKATVSVPVDFVGVDETWLLEHGVQPWHTLPLWIPQSEGGAAMGLHSRQRALESGITFRPLADTARDTWRWYEQTHKGAFDFGTSPQGPGLSPQREAELLKEWEARS